MQFYNTGSQAIYTIIQNICISTYQTFTAGLHIISPSSLMSAEASKYIGLSTTCMLYKNRYMYVYIATEIRERDRYAMHIMIIVM